MNPSTYKSLIAFIALSAALAGALGFGTYHVLGLGREAALAESATQAAGERSDRLLELERLLDQTEDRRALIDRAFVTPGSLVDFIESTEGLGRAAQVSLTLRSVEPDKTKNLLRVSLDASGRFERLFLLVSLLESLPPEVAITRLSMSKAPLPPLEKDPNTWNAHADLEASTYLNIKQ